MEEVTKRAYKQLKEAREARERLAMSKQGRRRKQLGELWK
jgi:hypothetical protein